MHVRVCSHGCVGVCTCVCTCACFKVNLWFLEYFPETQTAFCSAQISRPQMFCSTQKKTKNWNRKRCHPSFLGTPLFVFFQLKNVNNQPLPLPPLSRNCDFVRNVVQEQKKKRKKVFFWQRWSTFAFRPSGSWSCWCQASQSSGHSNTRKLHSLWYRVVNAGFALLKDLTPFYDWQCLLVDIVRNWIRIECVSLKRSLSVKQVHFIEHKHK